MNICSIFYRIFFRFSYATYSRLLVGKKTSLYSSAHLRNCQSENSGNTSDWLEGVNECFIQDKAGTVCSSTLCKAEDKEAKVKWVKECLGPTVSLFTFNKNTKNVTKKRMPHIRRCETVKIEITKLFWLLYFVCFRWTQCDDLDIFSSSTLWYMIIMLYFFLYNRRRWWCSSISLKGMGLV